MLEVLSYVRTREVKQPTRGTDEAAGIDFYIPTNLDDTIVNEKCKTTGVYPACIFENGYLKEMLLSPGDSVLLPSGIHVTLPKGYCLKFENKSGIAAKKHLICGSCVVAETVIKTNNGNFIAAELTKEFIEKNQILIESYDIENNKVVYAQFDGFRISNITECIKLTFDNGEEVECSEDHIIYTKNRGYQLAKDLTEDDIL